MAISHLLEDFSQHRLSMAIATVSEDALEDARLGAFESGYQAGWDDASLAHANDQSRISADFSQNLQALSFTYHEAYSHVVTSLQPLLVQMVETVLPHIAHKTLGMQIVVEAMRMARHLTEPLLQLTISPANRAQVESLLIAVLPIPIRIVEDNALGEGQVYLKVGTDERTLDLDSLLAKISDAVAGFIISVEGHEANG